MNEMGQLASTYIGLILVIGGLAFAASRLGWLVRIRQNTKSAISHLTTLTLTPQCSVAVIRTGQEELLLGLTAQQITLLTKTALTLSASHSKKEAITLTTCKRHSRKLTSKTRQIFPQCQFYSLPKASR